MILVTGATGFLGAELCKQLITAGKQVRALKRRDSKIPQLLRELNEIIWVEAALNDTYALENAFEGVTAVYHCAAMVSFDPAAEKEMFATNIRGTATIVDLCLEQNIRLLHVSSVAALGDAPLNALINEQCFPSADNQAHAYGISKYESEMEVWRGIAEGLDAVIVNPSVIIGPDAGFKGSGAIFKLVKDGLKFYTDGVSGFVHVRDVAKCMIALMDSKISGERFILSSENFGYKQLFDEIAKGLGVRPPTILAKPWMLGIAWRAAKLSSFITGKAPSLTRDAANSSMNHSFYDNSKVCAALDFNFIPINEAIEEITTALKLVS